MKPRIPIKPVIKVKDHSRFCKIIWAMKASISWCEYHEKTIMTRMNDDAKERHQMSESQWVLAK